jgi:hypothetical protein
MIFKKNNEYYVLSLKIFKIEDIMGNRLLKLDVLSYLFIKDIVILLQSGLNPEILSVRIQILILDNTLISAPLPSLIYVRVDYQVQQRYFGYYYLSFFHSFYEIQKLFSCFLFKALYMDFVIGMVISTKHI